MRVLRTQAHPVTWTYDSRGAEPGYVVQSWRESKPEFAKVAVVMDGSKSMQRFVRAHASKIASFIPPGARVFLAQDQLQELKGPIERELLNASFMGGQDNRPALEQAWDYVNGLHPGAVIWIHGPQPAELGEFTSLAQIFKSRPGAVTLIDVPIHPGPNLVAAGFSSPQPVWNGSLPGAAIDNVERAFRFLKRSRLAPHWTRGSEPPAGGIEASFHLARLWAAQEVQKSSASNRLRAVELAALYQLVTPVSGAVVLETAEQFKNAGLTPVDLKTVPTIPEPSTWSILLIGLGILALRKRRVRGISE